MAVSIQHRYNYANVIINENKVVMGRAISATNIPALLKNGDYAYRPFGGVIAKTDTLPKVKLVNIVKFWWNEDGFGPGLDIPIGDVVLGHLLHDKYYLVIENDAPIHWSETRAVTNYFTDNVQPIKRSKNK